MNALHIHAASVPLRPTDVRTPRTPPAFSHCLMVGKKVTPTRARVDPSHRARVQSLAVVGDVAQSSRLICVDLFFGPQTRLLYPFLNCPVERGLS